jgi:uncharacterized protein (DUF4415 family)
MKDQNRSDWKMMTLQIDSDLVEKLRVKAFEYGHGGKRRVVNNALRNYLQTEKK